MATLHGSICLSDIPKELIKSVVCKDGITRKYLNVKVVERREPVTFGDRTFTHFLAAACRKDEQQEGKKYIWGDLRAYEQQASFAPPTAEEIDAAQPVEDDNDLPF